MANNHMKMLLLYLIFPWSFLNRNFCQLIFRICTGNKDSNTIMRGPFNDIQAYMRWHLRWVGFSRWLIRAEDQAVMTKTDGFPKMEELLKWHEFHWGSRGKEKKPSSVLSFSNHWGWQTKLENKAIQMRNGGLGVAQQYSVCPACSRYWVWSLVPPRGSGWGWGDS